MHHFRQIFFAFTRGEKATFFLFSGAAVISGTILFGLLFVQATETVPASGGEYSEGVVGQPSLVNPVLASSEIDKDLVHLVFSNIYDIAEAIEPSSDGRIWRIRLKEKIFWHDGERLTSDDVIFTIQKIQDSASASPLAPMWQGAAAQRLSAMELQLSLINPYAFFPEILKTLYIFPKHVFGDIPPANMRLSDFNLRPIGSGPYKFISFEKRSDGFIVSYRLQRWKDYPEEGALIQNFNFRFFKDEDSLVQAFNSGQVDGFSASEPSILRLVERPYEIISFRLPSYYAVFFNQSKSIALKESVVRMALEKTADKNKIIELALSGHADPSFGPIPEGTPYFYDVQAALDDALPETKTAETNSAAQLLENAGWKLNDEGIREKTIQRSVIPLSFSLTVPKIGFMLKTAEILADEWKKLGAEVSIEAAESGEAISRAIRNRDYEALLFGNVLNRSFDLFSFWHSSERFHPGLNVALYNNKNADALIETIRQNLDEESRKAQFAELQGIIAGDRPALFLYSPRHLYVSGKNIRGMEARLLSEPAERFADAKNWYLRTARVLK